MTLFFSLAAVLVLLTLWPLVHVLVRQPASATAGKARDNAGNLRLLHVQRAQNDADRAAGRIGAGVVEQVRKPRRAGEIGASAVGLLGRRRRSRRKGCSTSHKCRDHGAHPVSLSLSVEQSLTRKGWPVI